MKARRFLPRAGKTPPDPVARGWLLASVALAVAPLAMWQPRWVPAAALGLLAWRAAAARWHWRLPGRWMLLALMGAILAGIHREFGTLLGRNPGVALLALLLALKLYELRRLRDHLLCVFLLFVLAAGSFLFDQSLWLGFYHSVTVVAGLATLVRLTQPDLGGARAVLHLTAGLLVRALPLVLVLYLLFPRLQGTLWGLPFDAYGGVTGMSDEMHPGSVNLVSQSEQVAFRARFAGAVPAPARLYWRVLVLWDTDGRSWLRTRALTWPAGEIAPDGAPLEYTITLEATQTPWWPALDLPAAAPPGARRTAAWTIEGPPVRERRQYALRSWPEYRTPALDPRERERALALGGESGRGTRELAARWRGAAPDDTALVQLALAHFHDAEFTYTLEPPELGDDPVEEFLFETRRGFCEHYTAAFVTLMRLAGVPARVVLGYQGGEPNPAGDYLIVRQSDAHAWAEVWLAGRGWVRVDPTAAVSPERIEYGAAALRRLYGQGYAVGRVPPELLRSALRLGWFEGLRRRGVLGWDALNNNWNRWVLGYDQRRQRETLQDFGFEARDWSTLAGWLALLTVAVLALLALPGLWRGRGHGDPVQAQYRRFCRKLARVGLARAPHEGPLDFAARCARRRPDLRPEVEHITRRYVGLRYDPGGRAGGERREFRRLVRRFRPA